jgi:hypothetical protein
MGVVDAWEQLSALERRASKKVDLNQELAPEALRLEDTSEPSTTLPPDSNENFQVG